MPPKRGPTIFDAQRDQTLRDQAPLAARMRPRSLDEFVGQEHLVGEGRLLRRAIANDQIFSMILWGRPAAARPPWRGSSPRAPTPTSSR